METERTEVKEMHKLAIIGDVHGCADELKQLVNYVRYKYSSYNVSFYHVGDLVDRGPKSGEVIDFVMKNFEGGVIGNHESTILRSWDKHKAYGYMPKNPDKASTVKQLNDRRAEYLKSLPLLHVFDDPKIVLVHGGLYPKIPFYQQAHMLNVCRLQMLKLEDVNQVLYSGRPIKDIPLHNRWWGPQANKQPKVGKTELQSMEEGYRRWYEEYDHDYDVVFGHSVIGVEPSIFETKGKGKAIGIDTGASFGGMLTAFIYPDMEYVQVRTGEYATGKNVAKMMEEMNENDRRISKRREGGQFRSRTHSGSSNQDS